ncbi:hypothetical protein B9Z19DRAFT_910213, partial [Tuber borchii]
LRFQAGWTYRRIAEDMGLSLTSVYRICESPATPKKRTGRPFSLDTPTRQRLVTTATASAVNRRLSFTEIAKLCDIQASEKTLRKAFKMEGYGRRVARK